MRDVFFGYLQDFISGVVAVAFVSALLMIAVSV